VCCSPSARVLSRLYRERTKVSLRANQSTVKPVRLILRPDVLMIQNGGHIFLGTGYTGFIVYQSSSETEKLLKMVEKLLLRQ